MHYTIVFPLWKCWLVYSQPFHLLLFSPFFVFRGIANDFYLHVCECEENFHHLKDTGVMFSCAQRFFYSFMFFFFLFIYKDPSRNQSRVWEPDGRVEPSTSGESALRVAVRTQIDSSQRCMFPRVIPGSRTRRRNPKGSFLVIFSVHVLLFLFLDSFLDRQHASTCSCLVIVVFVQKVFSHLANERLFFPSKFVLPLRLSRFQVPSRTMIAASFKYSILLDAHSHATTLKTF